MNNKGLRSYQVRSISQEYKNTENTLKILKVKMFKNAAKIGKYLGQAAKLMVGMPDYDTYVQHVKNTHPDQTPMSYEEFFIERQNARYGTGRGGCC